MKINVELLMLLAADLVGSAFAEESEYLAGIIFLIEFCKNHGSCILELECPTNDLLNCCFIV